MIGCIVLAAGLSERMAGTTPKQLLLSGGRPLVAITSAAAVAADVDRVVVVTGHRGEDVAAAVSDIAVVVAHNSDYEQGNMTSLVTGFRKIPECEAYVVLLADMPGVTGEMIDSLVARWRAEYPWAIVSSYTDKEGHPLLLSADAMQLAAGAIGPKAVWKLLAAAPEGAVVKEPFAGPAPVDVNTAADYGRLVE